MCLRTLNETSILATDDSLWWESVSRETASWMSSQCQPWKTDSQFSRLFSKHWPFSSWLSWFVSWLLTAVEKGFLEDFDVTTFVIKSIIISVGTLTLTFIRRKYQMTTRQLLSLVKQSLSCLSTKNDTHVGFKVQLCLLFLENKTKSDIQRVLRTWNKSIFRSSDCKKNRYSARV